MGLYWLEPSWTKATCASCGSTIYPEGDPDWGLCWPCMQHETERKMWEEEQRRLENEEMERHYREHPHG